MAIKIRWRNEPDVGNYPAVEAYVGLLCGARKAAELVRALHAAPVTKHKAADVLRASALTPGPTDPSLKKKKKKIRSGKKLSPLLLIRDGLRIAGKVVIADGYHRLCAVYEVDEDALVPCKIVTARPG